MAEQTIEELGKECERNKATFISVATYTLHWLKLLDNSPLNVDQKVYARMGISTLEDLLKFYK